MLTPRWHRICQEEVNRTATLRKQLLPLDVIVRAREVVMLDTPYYTEPIYLQVDVTPSKNAPQGRTVFGKHDRWPDPPRVHSEYRNETIKFLGRAGFPLSPVPRSGGMGAMFGAEIGMAIKAAGWLFRATEWAQSMRAKQRRAARRKLLPELNLIISINKAQHAVLPALAVLPELIDHLKEEFPQIRPYVILDCADSDFPCTIHFAPDTINDKLALVTIKYITKTTIEGNPFIGYRRRPARISWTQRKIYSDYWSLWEFMNPGEPNPMKRAGTAVTAKEQLDIQDE
ncbi:hypothetical protein [Kocuria sp. CH-021]|uniref:hypothetical protein n=1 Tax=Kocuria sp. CH-021 TaxID=3406735 RepID=UPI003C7780D7